MITLSWFLIVWLIAMAVFALLTFITVAMNMRYAPNGFFTYVSTAIFLGVIVVTLFMVGPYLATVDWSQTLTVWNGVRL